MLCLLHPFLVTGTILVVDLVRPRDMRAEIHLPLGADLRAGLRTGIPFPHLLGVVAETLIRPRFVEVLVTLVRLLQSVAVLGTLAPLFEHGLVHPLEVEAVHRLARGRDPWTLGLRPLTASPWTRGRGLLHHVVAPLSCARRLLPLGADLHPEGVPLLLLEGQRRHPEAGSVPGLSSLTCPSALVLVVVETLES